MASVTPAPANPISRSLERDPRIWCAFAAGLALLVLPAWLLRQNMPPIPMTDWPRPTPLSALPPSDHLTPTRDLFLAGGPTVDPLIAPPPAEPPVLQGVAIRARGGGVAIIRFGSGESRMLEVGEAAEGWTLSGLTRNQARLTGPEGDITIGFDFSNRVAGSPTIPSER